MDHYLSAQTRLINSDTKRYAYGRGTTWPPLAETETGDTFRFIRVRWSMDRGYEALRQSDGHWHPAKRILKGH